ncbi:hypothetical protein V12B01_13180 [Vibrio splendidus 12B01]|nr:hypothetical protein V12B01_13180 [Vibrio splendidus 12B01]
MANIPNVMTFNASVTPSSDLITVLVGWL